MLDPPKKTQKKKHTKTKKMNVYDRASKLYNEMLGIYFNQMKNFQMPKLER